MKWSQIIKAMYEALDLLEAAEKGRR